MSELSSVTPAVGAAVESRETALRHAAMEFEAMFVQLLLQSAKLPLGGGESTSPVYGDMATGAWSGELGRTGGFGVADLLVRALHDRETAAGGAAAEPVRPETGAARYRALVGER